MNLQSQFDKNPESAELIKSLVEMLQRFAVYGVELWDEENFRDGYKKIPSGLLVDCRKLIAFKTCSVCAESYNFLNHCRCKNETC